MMLIALGGQFIVLRFRHIFNGQLAADWNIVDLMTDMTWGEHCNCLFRPQITPLSHDNKFEKERLFKSYIVGTLRE